MHLADVPLLFILAGLALYTVLAGADFGAGIWQLTAGMGPGGGGAEAERLRNHAHDAMAPVWEANHVWLIFVLTVLWTAYPVAFGSIASTLAVPLFIAVVGIILRGAAYALRTGTRTAREVRIVDTLFAASSLLAPFALGTVVGAIAAQRVPVGNAAGAMFSSWTSPLSLLIGALAVLSAAYLAAVYLSADAARLGERDLEDRFRARALIAALAAGAVAIGGLVVLHADAHRLFHRLLDGQGLPALIVSVLAGLAAIALVWRRAFEPARYVAALAVAAIVAGWALAQEPVLLRGLTITRAAAPHDTLVAVVVAVLAGGAILFPSLALLFRLTLGGRLGHGASAGEESSPPPGAGALAAAIRPGVATRGAGACLLAGIGLLTVADAGWAHAIGVLSLFAFAILGFVAVGPVGLPG
jgi:cytochrome d ubiquinol oxidase subunit II